MSFAPLALATMQQKRSGRPFIIKVNYATGFTVTLPLVKGYNYNFIVDWGDGAVGQVTAYNDPDRVHTYSSGGTYTITMTGTLEGWTHASGMSEYIIGVDQGGRTGFKLLSFRACTRLTYFHGPTDTSGITSLRTTFRDCTGLVDDVDVSDWDVSNVLSFGDDSLFKDGMFSGCTNLTTLDVSNWTFNTTSDIHLDNMFLFCSKLSYLDVSGWNTERFAYMGGMFYGCTVLQNLDVSGWDTSGAIEMCTAGNSGSYGLFQNCTAFTALDVSGWNLTRATVLNNVFAGCTNITSLDTSTWSFNTTSNISLSGIFSNCQKLTTIGDTSGWNTTKFNVCSSMFAYCYKLQNFDVSGWSMGNVTNTSAMFRNCSLLYEDDLFDVSGWDMSNNTNMSWMFGYCIALTTIDISGWNISKVRNFGQRANFKSGMFVGCSNLLTLNLSAWSFNTTASVDTSFMFSECSKLTTIGDTSGWNTTQFVYTPGMFYLCSSLTSTDLDVSGWDMSNVLEMGFWSGGSNGMFQGCASLTTLDLSGWNVSKVIRFHDLLNGCSSLTTVGDISGWNVANGTLFHRMFQGCYSLTNIGGSGGNDLTGWNMAKATNISWMFASCQALTNLNLSGWDLGVCTDLSYVFYDCKTLSSLDISGWTLNTTSNINASRAFELCIAMVSLDLSSWDMTKVTSNSRMFYYCTELLTLTIPSTLSLVQDLFAAVCSKITTLNMYPNTAPTVSGTPFTARGSSCVLHVPSGTSSYTTSPWNSSTYFAQPITKDL